MKQYVLASNVQPVRERLVRTNDLSHLVNKPAIRIRFRDRKVIGKRPAFVIREYRLNARHHVHKIVALSEIYGTEALARALDDALQFETYSCEYIANLLESRVRQRPHDAAPLQVPRAGDLLELDVPEPDLSLYDGPEEDSE